jgi:tetratricopeptide (TPR) repeat protein
VLQTQAARERDTQNPMVDIPPALLEATKEQRAVLFLGAGASREAVHPRGEQIPAGDKLRDVICEKFLGGTLKDRPLTLISAMAANDAGLNTFQLFIRDLFLPFEPASFHDLIPTFRWRAIATTNFDLIIERAYARTPGRLQNLVKSVKDGDNFDARLNRETNPVGYHKLHGCIDYYADAEIPLILGTDQYASYEKNRIRFYARLRDLGQECPFIFAGYSISDPHIQRVLFDLTDPAIARPPFYLVSPGISDFETRYWATHRVFAIKATLEEFLKALDRKIPATARAVPIGVGGGTLSIRSHYRIAGTSEPAAVKAYLETDVTHINSGLTAERQAPEQFYRGNDQGWGSILQNLDTHRSVTESVLVDSILLPDESRKVAELFILKGPAGNGKTVALKRVAWEAAVTYGNLVLYVDTAAGLRIDPLQEIHALTGKRAILFLDRVALMRHELRDLLAAARGRNVPLTVVGAERDNEWNVYCDQLEPFVRQDFPVRYLSEKEIVELVALLERHNALGLLKHKTAQERLKAFMEVAQRQLLVALHQVTLGVAFEDIIFDEYRSIPSDAARALYLDICALHQFGANVRAGLVSRSSGINFDQFENDFFKPLENVVHVVRDQHTKDVFYKSRHQHVAEMLFNRALPTAEDRFDLLARLLRSINIDYLSDRETFIRLIRGRGIADIFPSIEIGRLFYDRVQEAILDDPFVFHQRAVFEMQHPGGSLVRAEEAAARAFALNNNSTSIQHTQAEIARRQANETDDPLMKRALRRVTRDKLGGVSRLSEYDLNTFARLAFDEFRELSNSLEVADEKNPPQALIDAARDTEQSIQRGLQLFPESSDILATEASFRDFLDQTGRALQTLQRAFTINPRQDWLAVRLARKYQDNNDLPAAKRTLEQCLQQNPSSKIAHLEMGRLLIKLGERSQGMEHLKRSFTEGDNHYEAQFWFARELFLSGHFDEAQKRFTSINERAPGRFRSRSAAIVEADGAPVVFEGSMVRKEEGYGFVKVAPFPDDIFASRAESQQANWDALSNGAEVECHIGFTRRGPRATEVSVHGARAA